MKAVKSSTSAQNIILKLSKKQGTPYLSFVIDFHHKEFKTVTQDVPITTLTTQALSELTEPTLDDPEVYISLPKPLGTKLKPVVERMKNIGEHLLVEANMDGFLKLKVETDIAVLSVSFKELDHPAMEGRDTPNRDPNKRCIIRVNIKKFASFLASSSVEPDGVVMCLVPDKAIVLHVLAGDTGMHMTYYIPVIVSD